MSTPRSDERRHKKKESGPYVTLAVHPETHNGRTPERQRTGGSRPNRQASTFCGMARSLNRYSEPTRPEYRTNETESIRYTHDRRKI